MSTKASRYSMSFIALLSAFVGPVSTAKASLVGEENLTLAAILQQMVMQVKQLELALQEAQRTAVNTYEGAKFATASLKKIHDYDDFVRAPSDLFGFSLEELPGGEELVQLRQIPTELQQSLKKGRDAGESLVRRAKAGAEKAHGELVDLWNPGGLERRASALWGGYRKTMERLAKQAAYAQQNGSAMVERLGGEGMAPHETATTQMRSQALTASASVESAKNLANLELRAAIRQNEQEKGVVLQADERASEIENMGLYADGHAKHSAQKMHQELARARR